MPSTQHSLEIYHDEQSNQYDQLWFAEIFEEALNSGVELGGLVEFHSDTSKRYNNCFQLSCSHSRVFCGGLAPFPANFSVFATNLLSSMQ
jgi:hypothetical protein